MEAARAGRQTGFERWRKPAIVAVSLGLHAVILGYMAFATIGGPRRYGEAPATYDPVIPPPILIQLEPRPVLRGETARSREPAAPDPAMQPIPDAGTRLTETSGATGSAESSAPPSPPAPRFAPSAEAGVAIAPPADVGSAQWRVRPESMGERVARGGRTGTVGCASPNLLTPQERSVCDQRFGERAAAAAPIGGTGNRERDARFAREGARALAEYEGRRRPLSGGSGLVGAADCPGSNFGTGCAGAHLDPSLSPESRANIRTRREGAVASGRPMTPGASTPRE